MEDTLSQKKLHKTASMEHRDAAIRRIAVAQRKAQQFAAMLQQDPLDLLRANNSSVARIALPGGKSFSGFTSTGTARASNDAIAQFRGLGSMGSKGGGLTADVTDVYSLLDVLLKIAETEDGDALESALGKHQDMITTGLGTVGETVLHLCFLHATPAHKVLATHLVRRFGEELVNKAYTGSE